MTGKNVSIHQKVIFAPGQAVKRLCEIHQARQLKKQDRPKNKSRKQAHELKQTLYFRHLDFVIVFATKPK